MTIISLQGDDSHFAHRCFAIILIALKRLIMKKLSFTLVFLFPLLMAAHPGHGFDAPGMWHYLLSPVHLIAVITAVAMGAALYKYHKVKRNQNA
jgi:hypothetical protein